MPLVAAHQAGAHVVGEAQAAAYLTLDEEGSPCMLFFDVVEARGYCAPGEEPEPLFRHAAPQASAEAQPNQRVYYHPAQHRRDTAIMERAQDMYSHLPSGRTPFGDK